MIHFVSIDTVRGIFRRYECTPGVPPRKVGRIDCADWQKIRAGDMELERESIEVFRKYG